MTKKGLTGLTLLMMAVSGLHADDTTGMWLNRTDNTQQCIDLGTIKKINFKDGSMVMLFENGETITVNVSEISTITFGSVPTAIAQMCDGKAGATYRIYDLKGEMVCEGKTSADGKATIGKELSGTYIIQVGNQCKTIVVK